MRAHAVSAPRPAIVRPTPDFSHASCGLELELDAIPARLPDAKSVRRICIQTVLEPGLESRLISVVQALRTASDLPISVCMNPTDPRWLPELKAAGVSRIGIGLDCATEETFQRVKPGFHWDGITASGRHRRYLHRIGPSDRRSGRQRRGPHPQDPGCARPALHGRTLRLHARAGAKLDCLRQMSNGTGPSSWRALPDHSGASAARGYGAQGRTALRDTH